MHEIGIVEPALETVLRQAGERRAQRVERVVLRVGVLAGVEPEALRFAFDALAHGTIAERAALEIDPVAAWVRCAACGREFEAAADDFIFPCPACGDVRGELRRGRELELSRIEMS
jgi:hydrogenase nickel incorporation protein HypA/HybF